MKIKTLLLSSLVLGSLTTQEATLVQANQHLSPVSIEVSGTKLKLRYLEAFPENASIQYAIWSEENGKDDLIFYNSQAGFADISLRNHAGSGTYHLETYLVQNGQKSLLKAETFQSLDNERQTDTPVTSSTNIQPNPTTVTPPTTTTRLETSTTTPSTTGNIATETSQTPQAQVTTAPLNQTTATQATSKGSTTVTQATTSQSISKPTTTSTSETNTRAANLLERSATSTSPKITTAFSSSHILTVKVTGITDNPYEVLLPTWTEKNGQDDIQWYGMKRQADGSYLLDIPLKNHNNETGVYNLHLYRRNKAGEALIGIGGTTVTPPTTSTVTPTPSAPKTPQFSLTSLNKATGSYILNVQPEKTITSMDIAVWSTSNQSNIKWYKVSANASNRYSLAVSIANHQNISGVYHNHVYINYADGTRVGYVANTADLTKPSTTVPVTYTPTASSRFVRSGTYELSLNNASTGEYLFAVWSDKNGQDDIGWYTANSLGSSSYGFQLDLNKHKDSGLYHFHIYKRNGTGLSGVLSTSFTVDPNHLTQTSPAPAPITTPSIPKTYVATNYPVGQCTWGVKQVAPWVGEWWGNAKDWANTAKNLGYIVSDTPRVGAVAVWPTDGGGFGHVAVVTHVDSPTRIQVLESNYAGKQYISNFRGWFNPYQVWNGSGYSPGPVHYIYPKG
ncbi:GBS Bsp-like repeat-containing protein [Streptococcus ovuberis]|uniref:CHAP domain-containing protein n=1 Tax=Streptococcus ovuberis TaxID=1936207 RepID=A0A7X6MZX7_9STRE|nr:GBS Bsp-like repeat-containing protein [Streptococcus ovuberis]NKZ19479.1 CHAP domain-containing protein [Streptococcus ovuberis]